ncbi:MAG TPA: Flp family type IVb pilin [Actinomycetota bacterium]|nr:Flp family type IVb pilin [Actinomycetota bacterium]
MVALQLWIEKVMGSLKDREDGAAAVEYGLLVGLIAVAIIVTVIALGGRLNAMFEAVRVALVNATPGSGGGTT